MKKNIFKNLVLSAFAASACAMASSCYVPDMSFITDMSSPYIFVLNENSSSRLGGYILSDLDSVDVLSDNSLKLFGGGKVILGTYRITQFAAEFHTTVTRGEGVRFIIRSNADTLDHPTALRFEYTTNGCQVLQGNSVLLKTNAPRVNLNAPEKIRITNYGELVRIEVGCNKIFERNFSIPSTTYVSIEALPGTEVLLKNVGFEETMPSKFISLTPNAQE